MSRAVRFVFLVAAALLLVGCPARWKVMLINGTLQPLRVSISGGLGGSPKAFTIQPGQSHTERFESVSSFAVFDQQGVRLFERSQLRLEDLPGRYPYFCILLTATNAYSIPPEYRKSWKEHVDEITQTR